MLGGGVVAAPVFRRRRCAAPLLLHAAVQPLVPSGFRYAPVHGVPPVEGWGMATVDRGSCSRTSPYHEFGWQDRGGPSLVSGHQDVSSRWPQASRLRPCQRRQCDRRFGVSGHRVVVVPDHCKVARNLNPGVAESLHGTDGHLIVGEEHGVELWTNGSNAAAAATPDASE